MGWYFNRRTRDDLVRDLSKDALLVQDNGRTFWTLHTVERECPGYKLGDTVICLDLIEQDGNLWGHKPLDEAMGPYAYDCPLEWLARANAGVNETWRAMVRKYRRAA